MKQKSKAALRPVKFRSRECDYTHLYIQCFFLTSSRMAYWTQAVGGHRSKDLVVVLKEPILEI